LIIAKLDRLARNVHFISGLIESGVEFVAVDMTEANRLTIHILAAVAEHEREMISKRTKDALQAAKARGTKLGSPTPKEGAAMRSRVLQEKAQRFATGALPDHQRVAESEYYQLQRDCPRPQCAWCTNRQ
jgi:DNA invertase Pin-like site-specific DNA recombinase